jgi:hypothetical protein
MIVLVSFVLLPSLPIYNICPYRPYECIHVQYEGIHVYVVTYESMKRLHSHAQNTHTLRAMPKVLAKALKALVAEVVAEVTVLVQRDQRGVVQQLLSLLRLPCQCQAQ